MKRLLPLLPLLLLLSCLPVDETESPVPAETDTWEGYGSQTVVLFFAEGGLEPTWQEELRVIELQEDPADRIARVLEELLHGPERGLGRAFPPGASLEHIFLEERSGVLTLDFNPVTVQLLIRAGSVEERIALEALKRVLRVNFPAVRHLRILVGGAATETLGGHLNIARALPLGGDTE
ncbi:MAG: GerMN domain-containing protein [bacterium]|nr:GerMN domain-containing protein [bacterium]